MAKIVTQSTVNRNARSVASLNREAQRFNALRDSRYEKAPVVMSAVTAGRNQVQINGGIYPAEGITGKGAAVAVVNVGTAAVAKYVPANRRSVESLAGSGRGGSGGGGTPGPAYTAGEAINITGAYEISVKRDAQGAIILGGGGGLKVNVGDGKQIATIALALNLATNPALEYGTAGDAGKVRVKVGNGIGRDATGVFLDLASVPGLEFGTAGDAGKVQVKSYHGLERTANGVGVKLLSGMTAMVADANGLAIANAIAGDGLGINATTKVLSVNVGDGIDIVSDAVAVDVTDIIDTGAGLQEDASNNIQIKRHTDSGLTFGLSGGLTLGTPLTLSVSSTNVVTGIQHNHAITSSSDVGTSPAAAILASNASGQLTLAQLTLRGNLIFAGGDRSITASNNLTIAPSTDLVLDPTGNVRLPIAQQVITDTFSDTIAGILGYRNFHLGDNVRQLSIGKIVADEMFVRAITYDEIRANRGQEFWGRSFGIVDTEFTLPADEATVDVWFEEAPDLGTAKLFLPDNWLLARSVDLGTGLTVLAVWFQVVDGDGAGTNDYLQRQNADPANGIPVSRQQWRLRRKSGGTTGAKIRRGNVIVDFGKPNSVLAPGQGIVHISALDTNGGPFLQIQRFMSVSSDVPQLVTLTRVGHLSGFAGQSAGLYGFGTGNDGSLSASGGSFSGQITDQTNGMRLFNVDLAIYQSTTRVLLLDRSTGLNFRQDSSAFNDAARYIAWYSSLDPTPTGLKAGIALFDNGTTNELAMISAIPSGGASAPRTRIGTLNNNTPQSMNWWIENDKATLNYDDNGVANNIILRATRTGRFGVNVNPASTGHFYENNSSSGAAVGVTVQNAGSGDAQLSFLQGANAYRIGVSSGALQFARGSDLATDRALTLSTIGNAIFYGDVTAPNINVTTNLSVANVAIVGNASYVEPYTGFNAQNNRVVIVRYATAHATSTPYTGFVFANNVTDTTDGVHSFLVFQNEAIGGGEQRIAQLVMRTDNGLDGGQYRFGVADGGVITEVLTIRKTGYVGIGTVTPGTNIIGTYDYVGSHLLQIGGATPTLLVHGSTNASIDLIDTGASANSRWFRIIKDGNNASFATVSDVGAETVHMTLTTAGWLGLGTENPGVDVVGTYDFPASAKTLQIDGIDPRLVVRGSSSASFALIDTGAGANSKWFHFTTFSGQTTFAAIGDSGTATYRFMTIDHSAGRIGVGEETSPTAYLDLAASAATGVRATTYGNTAYFPFVARRAAGTYSSPSAVSNGQMIGAWGAQGYGNSGWPANVQVEMQAQATENYTSTGRGAKLIFFTTANGATSATARVEIGQDGALVVPYIWATAVNGTAVQINSNGILTKATSSKRFKKNIRPLEGFGDDFVMALKPVLYNNKYGDDANDYVGFVAEDVFESGGKPFISLNNGLVESLHYDKLTVPLVAATQRLMRDREEDRSELRKLKERVAELERRLN